MDSTTSLDILVVDDHELILHGIKSQLADLLPHTRIDVFTDGEKALSTLKEKEYDLYILDIELKGISGFDLAQQIRVWYPEALILFNTLHEGIWYVRKIKSLKINGVAYKSACSKELENAVMEILNGNTYFSPRFKELNIDLKNNNYLLDEPFSPNDKEVLLLIGKGYTTKEIADKKAWSVKTVEHYRKRLFDKFGVANVSRLVAVSIKEGFIKKDDI